MTDDAGDSQASQTTWKAVILAAGRGQRLREGSAEGLKPLTPLLGLTLLERAVLSCRDAGVAECYVVVGYGRERMLPHLARLAPGHHLRLQAVDNPDWQEGNGTSALAVAPYLNEPFLLMMCERIGKINALFHPAAATARLHRRPRPACSAGASPSTLRRPAKAARSQAWHGFALWTCRSRWVTVESQGFPRVRASGRPV